MIRLAILLTLTATVNAAEPLFCVITQQPPATIERWRIVGIVAGPWQTKNGPWFPADETGSLTCAELGITRRGRYIEFDLGYDQFFLCHTGKLKFCPYPRLPDCREGDIGCL